MQLIYAMGITVDRYHFRTAIRLFHMKMTIILCHSISLFLLSLCDVYAIDCLQSLSRVFSSSPHISKGEGQLFFFTLGLFV